MTVVPRETSGVKNQKFGESPHFVRMLSICRRQGLFLSEDQQDLLIRYVGELKEWNRKINLVSRRDEANIWFSHILHSLSPLFLLDLADGLTILDLGSGGGFPGIPWAIARKDLKVVLLDSIRKKTVALENIAGRLALPNISVITDRAEILGKDTKQAHRYDVVVARAVAPLMDLIYWTIPLVRGVSSREQSRQSRRPGIRGRSLVALKGGDLSTELDQVRRAYPSFAITVIAIEFPGSLDIGLEDKKIIIVYL
jgi:16S rRNA (guanine527-N7)-methyltransferase